MVGLPAFMKTKHYFRDTKWLVLKSFSLTAILAWIRSDLATKFRLVTVQWRQGLCQSTEGSLDFTPRIKGKMLKYEIWWRRNNINKACLPNHYSLVKILCGERCKIILFSCIIILIFFQTGNITAVWKFLVYLIIIMDKWDSTCHLWFAELKYFSLYLQILPFWPGFLGLKRKMKSKIVHIDTK